MIQIALLVIAVGLLWPAIQGLRGVPDSKGNKTSPVVAIATLLAAIGIAVFALIGLPLLISFL